MIPLQFKPCDYFHIKTMLLPVATGLNKNSWARNGIPPYELLAKEFQRPSKWYKLLSLLLLPSRLFGKNVVRSTFWRQHTVRHRGTKVKLRWNFSLLASSHSSGSFFASHWGRKPSMVLVLDTTYSNSDLLGNGERVQWMLWGNKLDWLFWGILCRGSPCLIL